MSSVWIRVVIIILITLALMLCCLSGCIWRGNPDINATQTAQAINATATYGFEQFQIQLTAQANEND